MVNNQVLRASVLGHPWVFIVACPLAAAVLGCHFDGQRWIQPHLSVGSTFQLERWAMNVSQPSLYAPLCPACWSACVDKYLSSTSAEIRRVWECHRLQFMGGDDKDAVNDALTLGDVSAAWFVWSTASETALAGAFTDVGEMWEKLKMRSVALGGHQVRKSRSNFTDPTDGGLLFSTRKEG